MKHEKVRLIIILGGFFLLLDRFFKWQAIHRWLKPYLLNPYFGWQPFANQGVAFSFPLPTILTICITIPILILLTYLFLSEWKKPNTDLGLILACTLILSGALSNFSDRIIYLHVIDYIVIGTAIINLADILILFGLIVYMLKLLQRKKS